VVYERFRNVLTSKQHCENLAVGQGPPGGGAPSHGTTGTMGAVINSGGNKHPNDISVAITMIVVETIKGIMLFVMKELCCCYEDIIKGIMLFHFQSINQSINLYRAIVQRRVLQCGYAE